MKAKIKTIRTTDRVREIAAERLETIRVWGHDLEGDFCIMTQTDEGRYRSYKIKRISGEIVLVPI